MQQTTQQGAGSCPVNFVDNCGAGFPRTICPSPGEFPFEGKWLKSINKVFLTNSDGAPDGAPIKAYTHDYRKKWSGR